MANRDLEFVLKFRNDAKSVLQQANAYLQKLGRTAATVGTQMKQFNAAQVSSSIAMDKQAISAAKAEIAQNRLASSQARAVLEAQKAVLSTQKLSLEESRLAFQTDRLAFQKAKLAEQMNRAARAGGVFGGVIGQLKSVLAPLVGIYGAITAARIADEFTVLSTGIKNTTKSAAEYKQVFGGLFKIAQDTGASFSGLADGYVKLNISLADNLKESTDLVKVSELLARGFAASGTSAQTAAGATLQLTQGLATNFKSAGQELNSIIEGAPLLAKAIAVQLGGRSAADLKKFAEQGKLTSKIFLEALVAAEEQIKAFEIPATVGRAFERLRNQFVLLSGESEGFRLYAAALTKTLNFLATNLSTVVDIIAIAAATVIPALTAAILRGLVPAFTVLAGVIMANPILAIAGGISAVITSLYIFRKEIFETAKKFEVFGTPVLEILAFLADAVVGTFSGATKEIDSLMNKVKVALFQLDDYVFTNTPNIAKAMGITQQSLDDQAKNIDTSLIGLKLGEGFNRGFKEATENGALAKLLSSDFTITDPVGGTSGKGKPGSGNADDTAALTKEQENFNRSLREQIETYKEEIKWVGKSSKERERAIVLLKAQQDAIKAGIKDFNPSELLAAYDALEAAKERIHTDFGTGLKAAMDSFIENAKGAGDLAQDIFRTTADGIESTITGLVDGSIKSFEDLKAGVANILRDLSSQIMKYLVIQQLVVPLAKSAGLSGFASFLTKSAQGNVISGGQRITAFAKGGITNGPELFPMNNGLGLRGEAGPEAIMPVRRMPGGDLGVQAMTGSNKTLINYSPSFNFTLEGGSGGGADGQKERMDGLLRVMDNETRKLVYEILEREQRPGGRLYGGRSQTV